MKHMMTSVAIASLLFVGTAIAQGSYVELDDDVQVPAFSMTVDDLEDLDVFNSSGQKIGAVEEVLGTDAQTASAVSVDFKDEVARDDRVVELSNLTSEGRQLVIDLDTAAISQLPVYDD